MASTNRYSGLLCLAALLTLCGPHLASGGQQRPARQATGQAADFVRLQGPGDSPAALQTSVLRYRDPRRIDVHVDLVSAIHIGEAGYFATLNELFRNYDVVLYELVAEPGARIPRAGPPGSGNPVSFLQTTARSFLGLESQLEQVDYTGDNFRHADLGPADLAARMRQRGDTGWSLAVDALAEMMQRAGKTEAMTAAGQSITLDGLLELMSDPLKAKQFMARQLGSARLIEGGLGEKLNQLIIVDRNQAAAGVLDEELESGSTKIAIFYGAAHMPDFHQRLEHRGFRPAGQSWITAWDLTRSPARRQAPMSRLIDMMRQLDR